MWKFIGLVSVTTMLTLPTLANAESVMLYMQDFESPAGFVAGPTYKDVSQQQVNTLYGGQPVGFSFAQAYTVETVLLTGTQAFGTGYSDPSGKGGNYAIGMLSSTQSDLLGLSFDVGNYDFFNFTVDISSLGLDGSGGPFTTDQLVPQFKFTLFDNPSGAVTTGSGLGTILDTAIIDGTSSMINTLDWTQASLSFDTSLASNGRVTLQVDLVTGGYAVLDNFSISASDEPLPTVVPLPAAAWLFGLGLAALAGIKHKKQTQQDQQ